MAGKTVAKLVIDGVIEEKNETYNQKWILEQIKDISEDKTNAGLLLFIDSPGGGVYESDEVFEAVLKYKRETKRPVYAYFASLAASGGYYIGCSADKIFANRNTLTGSIGVIAGRFVDLTELMKKHGIKSETIHAGRNKVMGSFTESVTEEQKKIMQSVADECYCQFTQIVSECRKLDIERVRELADGRIYTANQAKNSGLVDDVMNFEEAKNLIYTEVFGNKDYKKDLEEYKYKPKPSLIKKFLKQTSFNFGKLDALTEIALKSAKLPFPAFYYDSQRF